jgi:hypothetical protein
MGSIQYDNIPYLNLKSLHNENPLILKIKSCILGIGYGFLLMHLFNSQKFVINRTDPSFLGIIKLVLPIQIDLPS